MYCTNFTFYLCSQEPSEFQIDEVFHVDHSMVVGGLLTKGVITQGTTLLLGKYSYSRFRISYIV